MDNAVQSEIAIINNIELKLGDKDYYLCREMDLLMVIR